MVFFELRWNYSPLKEKAVLLPDGLFVCFLSLRCASLHTAIVHFFLIESISAPNASRSARGRPRGVNNSGQNLSRARLAPHRYTVFSPLGAITLLRQQARRMIGLALNLYYWSLRDKPLQSIYVFDLFLLLVQAARHMVSLAA
jgi:hypothetical protein